MKKQLAKALALCLLLGALGGCGANQKKQEAPSPPERLVIYTSFYIMYDFASKIAGNNATVVNMMPPGTEAHDWEPTPGEIAGLESAAVFFYNGAGLEGWVERVIPTLQNRALCSVNTSADIPLLEQNHEEKEQEYEGHTHGAYDPHVWLSPQNAKEQLFAIKEALVQIDPASAVDYEANYRLYAQRCEALDQEFIQRLDKRARDKVVVAHEAYGYLFAAYGLEQYGVKGYSPDVEPTPYKMAEIIDFIKAEDIPVILFEEAGSKAVAQAIARETNTRLALLSPIEWITKERQAAGEDYFSCMESNLASLEQAVQ